MRYKEEYKFKSITELAKIIGRKWNELTEAEKEPFVKLMNQDKERYLREVEMSGMRNQIAEKVANLENSEDGEDV